VASKSEAWARAVRSAHYYERKAEEIRTIADLTRDPWSRKVLDGVAADYLRLAGQMLNEERRAERSSGKPI
jgi:hypothetical protein